MSLPVKHRNYRNLPRNAMRNLHGTCCRPVSVRPSVRHVQTDKDIVKFLSRAGIALSFWFLETIQCYPIPREPTQLER